MAELRNKYWSTIIYPEDNKTDWRNELEQLKIQVAISPLHDKDTYEKDSETHKKGELKKKHYHIVFIFGSLKSAKQVKEITGKLGAVGQESVNSIKQMLRYLAHLDNPKKAQYNLEDVQTLGGLNIEEFILDQDEKVNSDISKIMGFIFEKNLVEFCELCEFISTVEPQLFTTLRKNAYFFTQYIRSKSKFTLNSLPIQEY